MVTECILFSTLAIKAHVMCKRASNQSPDLKNYTGPGPRNPPPPPRCKKVLISTNVRDDYERRGVKGGCHM